MLELINQLDGFDPRGNIKVLMATNRQLSFLSSKTLFLTGQTPSTQHFFVQVASIARWNSRCRIWKYFNAPCWFVPSTSGSCQHFEDSCTQHECGTRHSLRADCSSLSQLYWFYSSVAIFSPTSRCWDEKCLHWSWHVRHSSSPKSSYCCAVLMGNFPPFNSLPRRRISLKRSTKSLRVTPSSAPPPNTWRLFLNCRI